tara:strand:+ start:501 stop:1451 length:951 start_codon:yes stop_codon:yes gene_type:complete
MRQAGRYLPEFRDIRKKKPDFFKLCLDTDLASKITLQPIKRFDLDAAIIFSDILMVPYALGQNIEFVDNVGPRTIDFNLDKFLSIKKDYFLSKLKPVYNSIKKTRSLLNKDKSLIAFVGAPWTLLIYLLNMKDKKLLGDKPIKYDKQTANVIIEKLSEFLKYHIYNQIKSGADIVQIFDSWAGLLNKEDLEDLCYKPNLELVNFCKENNIPTICFPKGLGAFYKNFVDYVKPDGISIDYDIDPQWAKENLNKCCIQGGMKPSLLLEKEEIVIKEVEKYLRTFNNNPYIFNLGHGILPQTNPNIITKIIEKIRNIKR